MNLDQFIVEAGGHGPCVGVHAKTPLPLVVPSGIDVRILDGASTETLEELYDAVAEVWQFPPWFGHNANAFNDFMRDLDNMVTAGTNKPPPSGYLTDVTDAHLLLNRQPEAFSWFASKLPLYRAYYRDELKPPATFGLLLSAPTDKLGEVRERWLSVGVQVADVEV
ncbi:hypothetical protein A5647_17135 [Mycobacterium sp. 1100029.7]|nr:hypothetical protein A5647_17135 [Mycobacterium sp. 1100029.7]